MKSNLRYRGVLFVSPLLLSLALSITNAQRRQTTSVESVNYGFVSPNTRDDLKLEDAVNGMSSVEESNLQRNAVNLGCVLKRKVSTTPAVGSWSDGAEHSILIRVSADESAIRYLMSRLGRDANQKAVAYFHSKAGGRAKIYIIAHIRDFNLRQIGGVLDRSGIAFRTLVPARHGTNIYIIDLENSLRRKVLEASRKLNHRITSQSGNAAFIGDDSSRDKGQAVFAQEIKQYELKHPRLPPPCEVNQ